MKQTVNFNSFVQAFKDAGRAHQYSQRGLQAIYDYIEDYERDSGEEIELDVVGLCCDWTECSYQEIADDYDIDLSDCEDDDDKVQAVEAYLDGHTQYVNLDGDSFIYVVF
jgi:hypothetical protein